MWNPQLSLTNCASIGQPRSSSTFATRSTIKHRRWARFRRARCQSARRRNRGRGDIILRCDTPPFAHKAHPKSCLRMRHVGDIGDARARAPREISHIAAESGPQACVRAATAIPIPWRYRAIEKYGGGEAFLFKEDPRGSSFLSELSGELSGADDAPRSDGNILLNNSAPRLRRRLAWISKPPRPVFAESVNYSRIAPRNPGATCHRDRRAAVALRQATVGRPGAANAPHRRRCSLPHEIGRHIYGRFTRKITFPYAENIAVGRWRHSPMSTVRSRFRHKPSTYPR